MTAAVARAQTDAGKIVGTVTDSSGAIIPGVTISVVSEKTGQERTVITNASGDYIVTPLPPETYTVKASLSGLSAPEYKGIALQVGQQKTLNITMQAAGVETEISVSGEIWRS
jgi:hypothetical protein